MRAGVWRRALIGTVSAFVLGWAQPGPAAFMDKIVDTRKGDLYLSCGNHLNEDTIPIRKITDCMGNLLEIDCVKDTYFQGKITRKDGTVYAFGKCVFDGALNKLIYLLDAQGNFKKILWFNVEDPGALTFAQLCNGSKVEDTMDPKAFDDAEAKIRAAIKDRGLDANIYMTSFSPGDQLIQRYTDGVFSSDLFLTPSDANLQYPINTGTSILALDPIMFAPKNARNTLSLRPFPSRRAGSPLSPAPWSFASPAFGFAGEELPHEPSPLGRSAGLSRHRRCRGRWASDHRLRPRTTSFEPRDSLQADLGDRTGLLRWSDERDDEPARRWREHPTSDHQFRVRHLLAPDLE
jgi:hypothetical protein